MKPKGRAEGIILGVLTTIVLGARPVAAVVNTATPAQPGAPKQGQLAQLVGTCRAVNDAVFVYQTASTSTPIRSLPKGTIVRLATNAGVNGFIAIDSPVVGFVQTKNLVVAPCPGQPAPGITLRVCEITRTFGGLTINREPRQGTGNAGTGVGPGEQITTTTNPPIVHPPNRQPDANGYVWMRVARPVVGWIAVSRNGVRYVEPCR